MTAETTIAATTLADRVAAGRPVTVLDVRDDAAWGIEGPGVRSLHVPATRALTDPANVARGLTGPVAVVCNRGVKARPVARALRDQGVDARALQDGMRGWIAALQARPVQLGLDGVVVLQIQRPGRGCLSYLVAAGGEALVVDPAPDAGFYEALARGLAVRITDVVDTHLHADHLSGARALAERSDARLRLPARALERGVVYADRVMQLNDGDALGLGGSTLRALALPGHTTDMTGLLLEGRALMSGDSLFADGIARPDLQRGDADGARAMARKLHATLHERVLALDDDVVLLPGHTHPGVHAAAVAPALRDVRAAVPELAIAEADEFADALLAGMPPPPANYEAVIAVNAGARPFDPHLETGGNSCATR
jgi:glyoxylase-like metal-dependent hydrolase (beta-lactamase superfamily II)/rhodanese-related sulfurtransferase